MMLVSESQAVLHFYIKDNVTQEWIAWANLMHSAVGTYSLFQIYTAPLHRGKGHGTKLVKDILKWADREGAMLVIEVGTWGEPGLNNEELFKWYSSLGFKYHSVGPKLYPTQVQRIIMTYQGRK